MSRIENGHRVPNTYRQISEVNVDNRLIESSRITARPLKGIGAIRNYLGEHITQARQDAYGRAAMARIDREERRLEKENRGHSYTEEEWYRNSGNAGHQN